MIGIGVLSLKDSAYIITDIALKLDYLLVTNTLILIQRVRPYLRNNDRHVPGSDDAAWKRRRRQDDEVAVSN